MIYPTGYKFHLAGGYGFLPLIILLAMCYFRAMMTLSSSPFLHSQLGSGLALFLSSYGNQQPLSIRFTQGQTTIFGKKCLKIASSRSRPPGAVFPVLILWSLELASEFFQDFSRMI